MVLTLILGIAAGYAAPQLEPRIRRALEGMLLDELKLEATEFRMFAFALTLLMAAIVAAIFGGDSAIVLSFGAALGVLAPRLLDRIRGRSGPDYS